MRVGSWIVVIAAGLLSMSQPVRADAPSPLQQIGDASLKDWIGLNFNANDIASLSLPSDATFRFADGPRGFYKYGFRLLNDGTADWQAMYGLRFETTLPDANAVEITVTLITPRSSGVDKTTTAVVNVSGIGDHMITLPWGAFDLNGADTSPLKYIKAVSISAKLIDGKGGSIELQNVQAIEAPAVGLSCEVRGKGVPVGATADYIVRVSNTTGQPEAVTLGFKPYGWEVMQASVEPSALQLAPGESKPITVHVTVPDRVAPGGHENQVLQAIANGDADRAQKMTFITLRELPHPYILHTAARWQEVRDKVAQFEWAKAAQEAYMKRAEAWQVPEIARPPKNDPDDTYGPFLFATQNENPLLACAYTWELTHDKSAAEKVATFLRRLSDPTDGYPKTLRGCNQSQVQEGLFFQHIAMSYDMVQDAGVLSDADRKQIEITFRLFMGTIARELDHGAINNWNLSEACGAFYCALAMQDLVAADRFFAGPSGIKDQLSKGTMDDGWWYECSISYNMWCASEFTQAAMAYEPFGYEFLHEKLPASYSPKVLLTSDLNGGTVNPGKDPAMRDKPFGMNPEIFGPNRRNYRTITDLWDGLLPFINYKGVMFGVNDSSESVVTGNRAEVSGQPFEIAYYAFRDPKYAAIIKMGTGRDLLYGVPELPEKTPELFNQNAYADNVGLALLRSQTPNKPPREQIQAVLHYGTHGWAHGHYDRTDLLSLMRYDRSFWSPEAIWWGYEPFMYKFYVQTSVNHNMVVVDQKMQEATPGKRLLFYTGHALQAAAVETTARWSHPPYGGMVYDSVPVKTFAEKGLREGRSVPEPTTKPAYGTLTEFTEPILQRRLMVVTDDYVVIADYLKALQPHTFDSLLQLRGFDGIEGAKPDHHTAQYNADPRSSAQFITDCDWYHLAGPSLATFTERYGKGTDQSGNRTFGNDDGVLNLGIHTAWPLDQQIMVATSAEEHDTAKRLRYAVRGDGKTLASGQFGSWILGRGDIDVPLDGVKQLELETKTELAKNPTLFWVNAKVITRDGRAIPLSQLPTKVDNVLPSKGRGKDYFGGPIKIQGDLYSEAIAAEPEDAHRPGIVRVDLSGINAVRLQASIGGDYPLGNETQRRKTFAVRSEGTEARFLTVIEPYETKSVIQSVKADGPDAVTVILTDGRSQQIKINAFQGDGASITVNLSETKDGKTLREETASGGKE